MTNRLPPALEAEYKWLKRQVDHAQDELYKIDANRRASINYKLAVDDLKKFVSDRRKEGYNI